MKKLVVILLSVFAFVACSKGDLLPYPTDKFDFYGQSKYFAQFIERGLPKKLPEGWFLEETHYESDGGGLRSNSFCVYFIDEEGNSLIDINDYTTWPVPMSISKAAADPDNYYANMTTVNERQIAFVAQGDANELPFFHMMAPVNDEHTNSFKLRMLGKEYDMKITYLYEAGATGGCCYSHIFRWDINGELLYSDFESTYDFNGLGISSQAVVIIKKDGTLSVERIWEKK